MQREADFWFFTSRQETIGPKSRLCLMKKTALFFEFSGLKK
jgi:hypothetical protein